MDKQAEIEMQYRMKQKRYEEQEEELLFQRNKALAIIEEVQNRCNYYLKDIVSDRNLLMDGHKYMETVRDDIFKLANNQLKVIDREKDEVRMEYARKLEEANENKKKG